MQGDVTVDYYTLADDLTVASLAVCWQMMKGAGFKFSPSCATMLAI